MLLFPSNAIKWKIFLIQFAHFWVHLQKVYMLRISSNFKSTYQQRYYMLQKHQHCQRAIAAVLHSLLVSRCRHAEVSVRS